MDVAIPIGREFHFAARFLRRSKNRLQMRGVCFGATVGLPYRRPNLTWQKDETINEAMRWMLI
jgi:hypothetical protein